MTNPEHYDRQEARGEAAEQAGDPGPAEDRFWDFEPYDPYGSGYSLSDPKHPDFPSWV